MHHNVFTHERTLLGLLKDDAMGMFAYDTVYSDNNVDQIEALPPTAFHRNVDWKFSMQTREGCALG